MAGQLASAVWTDPPYGVAYQTKLSVEEAVARNRRRDGLEVSNDDLTPAATRQLLAAAAIAAGEYLSPGSAFYVASPSGDMELYLRLALEDAGWRLRQSLVWVKDVFVMGRQDYHWRHETILYGWTAGTHHWRGGRKQSTVFEIARPKRSEEHPTMKPVELIVVHLANATEPGDAVLDPFAGSGSTMLACEQIGCAARLMEIDPAYCDVIRQRYADYVGDQKWAP